MSRAVIATPKRRDQPTVCLGSSQGSRRAWPSSRLRLRLRPFDVGRWTLAVRRSAADRVTGPPRSGVASPTPDSPVSVPSTLDVGRWRVKDRENGPGGRFEICSVGAVLRVDGPFPRAAHARRLPGAVGCNRFAGKRCAVNANWPLGGRDLATVTRTGLPGLSPSHPQPQVMRDRVASRAQGSRQTTDDYEHEHEHERIGPCVSSGQNVEHPQLRPTTIPRYAPRATHTHRFSFVLVLVLVTRNRPSQHCPPTSGHARSCGEPCPGFSTDDGRLRARARADWAVCVQRPKRGTSAATSDHHPTIRSPRPIPIASRSCSCSCSSLVIVPRSTVPQPQSCEIVWRAVPRVLDRRRTITSTSTSTSGLGRVCPAAKTWNIRSYVRPPSHDTLPARPIPIASRSCSCSCSSLVLVPRSTVPQPQVMRDRVASRAQGSRQTTDDYEHEHEHERIGPCVSSGQNVEHPQLRPTTIPRYTPRRDPYPSLLVRARARARHSYSSLAALPPQPQSMRDRVASRAQGSRQTTDDYEHEHERIGPCVSSGQNVEHPQLRPTTIPRYTPRATHTHRFSFVLVLVLVTRNRPSQHCPPTSGHARSCGEPCPGFSTDDGRLRARARAGFGPRVSSGQNVEHPQLRPTTIPPYTPRATHTHRFSFVLVLVLVTRTRPSQHCPPTSGHARSCGEPCPGFSTDDGRLRARARARADWAVCVPAKTWNIRSYAPLPSHDTLPATHTHRFSFVLVLVLVTRNRPSQHCAPTSVHARSCGEPCPGFSRRRTITSTHSEHEHERIGPCVSSGQNVEHPQLCPTTIPRSLPARPIPIASRSCSCSCSSLVIVPRSTVPQPQVMRDRVASRAQGSSTDDGRLRSTSTSGLGRVCPAAKTWNIRSYVRPPSHDTLPRDPYPSLLVRARARARHSYSSLAALPTTSVHARSCGEPCPGFSTDDGRLRARARARADWAVCVQRPKRGTSAATSDHHPTIHSPARPIPIASRSCSCSCSSLVLVPRSTVPQPQVMRDRVASRAQGSRQTTDDYEHEHEHERIGPCVSSGQNVEHPQLRPTTIPRYAPRATHTPSLLVRARARARHSYSSLAALSPNLRSCEIVWRAVPRVLDRRDWTITST